MIVEVSGTSVTSAALGLMSVRSRGEVAAKPVTALTVTARRSGGVGRREADEQVVILAPNSVGRAGLAPRPGCPGWRLRAGPLCTTPTIMSVTAAAVDGFMTVDCSLGWICPPCGRAIDTRVSMAAS